ncbi:hypothetical protein OV320_2628 [Actinobacteria bacterium OV320]|jgi:hypothetical protein|nr:hypothetical protein OV320_2628 [Actinobacteria bacterium OV320]
MGAARTDCPSCLKPVLMSEYGRLDEHGSPRCERSGKRVGRIWPAKHFGRRVQTVPGPDTWNPTALEGAA